jgi:hypothetical protein
MSTPSGAGPDAFIAGLRRCGVESTTNNGVVTFAVEAFDGAHAGQPVLTGVSTEELQSWPLTPPHWVHFPAEIKFAQTNSQASAVPGWLRHSRQIHGWGSAPEPAQAWIAHVRGVLGEAA